MKKKQFLDEIKAKSAAELTALAREKEEKMRTLRFDLVMGKVKNTKEVHVLRKQKATVLTVLHEKQKEVK